MQRPWISFILAEIPSHSSPPMGLTVFWYIVRSICFEAIGKRLPSVWEFVRPRLRPIQRAVLTPMVSLIHASKAQGTRRKGNFFKKASYRSWDFTTACPKQQMTLLYILAHSHKPHLWSVMGTPQKHVNLSINHKNTLKLYTIS